MQEKTVVFGTYNNMHSFTIRWKCWLWHVLRNICRSWCTIFIWSKCSCKLFLWDNKKSHLRWMLWDTVTESLEKEILAKCSTDSLMQTFHWEFLGEKSSQSSQLQMEQDIRFFSDACNLWRDYNRPWKGGFIAEQSVWTKCTSHLFTNFLQSTVAVFSILGKNISGWSIC